MVVSETSGGRARDDGDDGRRGGLGMRWWWGGYLGVPGGRVRTGRAGKALGLFYGGTVSCADLPRYYVCVCVLSCSRRAFVLFCFVSSKAGEGVRTAWVAHGRVSGLTVRDVLSHYYCEGEGEVGIVDAYPPEKEAEKGVLGEIETRPSQFCRAGERSVCGRASAFFPPGTCPGRGYPVREEVICF